MESRPRILAWRALAAGGRMREWPAPHFASEDCMTELRVAKALVKRVGIEPATPVVSSIERLITPT